MTPIFPEREELYVKRDGEFIPANLCPFCLISLSRDVHQKCEQEALDSWIGKCSVIELLEYCKSRGWRGIVDTGSKPYGDYKSIIFYRDSMKSLCGQQTIGRTPEEALEEGIEILKGKLGSGWNTLI